MPGSLGLTTESHSWDNLFAGNYPRITKSVIIVSGQNIKRGTLLGKITASGKYTEAISGAVDGSDVPILVLANDIDASAGDIEAIAFQSGEFNEVELDRKKTASDLFTSGKLSDATKEALRALNIYIHDASKV